MRLFLLSASALAIAALTPTAAYADCFEKLDAARDQIEGNPEALEELTQRFGVDYETAAALAETDPAACEAMAERLETLVELAMLPSPSDSVAVRAMDVVHRVVTANMELTTQVTSASAEAGESAPADVEQASNSVVEEARRLAEEAAANHPTAMMRRVVAEGFARLTKAVKDYDGTLRISAGQRPSNSLIREAQARQTEAMQQVSQMQVALNDPKQPLPGQPEQSAGGRYTYDDALPAAYKQAAAALEKEWQAANDEAEKYCDDQMAIWESAYVANPGKSSVSFEEQMASCSQKIDAVNKKYMAKDDALRAQFRVEIAHAKAVDAQSRLNGKPGGEEIIAKMMEEHRAKTGKKPFYKEIGETKDPLAKAKKPANPKSGKEAAERAAVERERKDLEANIDALRQSREHALYQIENNPLRRAIWEEELKKIDESIAYNEQQLANLQQDTGKPKVPFADLRTLKVGDKLSVDDDQISEVGSLVQTALHARALREGKTPPSFSEEPNVEYMKDGRLTAIGYELLTEGIIEYDQRDREEFRASHVKKARLQNLQDTQQAYAKTFQNMKEGKVHQREVEAAQQALDKAEAEYKAALTPEELDAYMQQKYSGKAEQGDNPPKDLGVLKQNVRDTEEAYEKTLQNLAEGKIHQRELEAAEKARLKAEKEYSAALGPEERDAYLQQKQTELANTRHKLDEKVRDTQQAYRGVLEKKDAYGLSEREVMEAEKAARNAQMALESFDRQALQQTP